MPHCLLVPCFLLPSKVEWWQRWWPSLQSSVGTVPEVIPRTWHAFSWWGRMLLLFGWPSVSSPFCPQFQVVFPAYFHRVLDVIGAGVVGHPVLWTYITSETDSKNGFPGGYFFTIPVGFHSASFFLVCPDGGKV